MRAAPQLAVIAGVILLSVQLLAQETPSSPPAEPPAAAKNPWAYNLTVDGYIAPDSTSYVNPVFSANRDWLHLEARYNTENLHTGSLWAGYNFSAGKKLVLEVTPMIGGLFGRTNGIAPGCEASLSYKKVEFSIENEYVFDTTHKSGNFYYAWMEARYSLTNWLRVGVVAEHTKAFQTSLQVQRAVLVGVSHKQWEFTTYIYDPELAEPTVVLEAGVNF